MAAEQEPANIETIADVISQLEYHRQTHTEWAEHFERHPDADPGNLGDAAFHRAVEGRYTKMIEVLHALTGEKGDG